MTASSPIAKQTSESTLPKDALLDAAGFVINRAVAELVIRRRSGRRDSPPRGGRECA